MSKRKMKEDVDIKYKDDKLVCGYEEMHDKSINEEQIEKALVLSSRKRKKQSPVWEYFRESVNESGKPVAECMFCDGVFTMMHGTSTLARHAKKHGMGENQKSALHSNDSDSLKVGSLSVATPKFDRKTGAKSDDEITEALISWMADSQVSCDAVENRKFQKLFHIIAPRYTLPNSDYVKTKLIEKREVFLRRADNIIHKLETDI